MAIVGAVVTSCSDDDNNPSGTSIEKVRTTVQDGQWRISSLIKDGSDLSGNFADTDFDFNNGVVTATAASDVWTGSYSLPNQTSSSAGYKVITMYFADEPNFAILNDHWRIITLTDDKITLKYVDQDTVDDTMILEKN